MPKSPDRAILSRLVDAYDRISEESLGTGDPEFHEIEDQLFDAIVESPYRAVIKNGDIYFYCFPYNLRSFFSRGKTLRER